MIHGLPGAVGCLLLLLSLSPLRAGVPEAVVEENVIRLPVVEGAPMRFNRLSTSNGLSQTRVSQIVQDDEGFHLVRHAIRAQSL